MKDILYFNTLEDIKLIKMMRVVKSEMEHDYNNEYLTFRALENGKFGFTVDHRFGSFTDESHWAAIEYRKNNGSWNRVSIESDDGLRRYYLICTVKTGDTVQLKGNITKTCDYNCDSVITSTCKYTISGCLFSLFWGDEFKEHSEFPEFGSEAYYSRSCNNMFSSSLIVNAENLIFPDAIGYECYSGMFKNSLYLTKAPKILPAMNLELGCYLYMFQNCTSLVQAPELPATVLDYYCYANMFNGCTSLTTAPILPAHTLCKLCYAYMFTNCSSLNYIKALFTTTPNNSSLYKYTYEWVSGVSETGTFVKNVNATWATTGTSGVPTGWTVQTDVPYEDPIEPFNGEN